MHRSGTRIMVSSAQILDIEFAQPQGISSLLSDQADDIIIALSGHVARHGMVRLEDVASALGRVELAQDNGPELLPAAIRPFHDAHVPAETDALAVMLSQVDDVKPG